MTDCSSGLCRAIRRRLRAMWPLEKIVADLADPVSGRLIANAVRAVSADSVGVHGEGDGHASS